jgi:hypothetical protein
MSEPLSSIIRSCHGSTVLAPFYSMQLLHVLHEFYSLELGSRNSLLGVVSFCPQSNIRITPEICRMQEKRLQKTSAAPFALCHTNKSVED